MSNQYRHKPEINSGWDTISVLNKIKRVVSEIYRLTLRVNPGIIYDK